MIRSRQVTRLPQRKKIEARKPTNGSVTPKRFVIFWPRLIWSSAGTAMVVSLTGAGE
jgi:hypothetical protein